jgi:hypothetical protein
VVKRSETVTRRSEEESEWYTVEVGILTSSSLVRGRRGLAEFRGVEVDVRVGEV